MTEPENPLPQNFDLTLLANFVHQVVNPLNGVAGTLDNLADGVIKDKNRQLQRLNVARAQLEQCITLMRNLAFLAQGSGGVAEQDRRKIVLPQVIIESAMFFQEDGARKGIEINLKDRSTQNMVYGHPELIRQVLMNIFDNFIKYGKPNEEIVVEQRIQRRTGKALISIQGTSAYPIRAEDLPHLTDLGFRGENARKLVASGTGLGLFISKKIVSDHGGELEISVSGRDQVQFLIKLPEGWEQEGTR